MPLLLIPLLLIALIYGALQAFNLLASHFGLVTAVISATVSGLLIAAALLRWYLRWREVSPNSTEAGWTHQLKGPWGHLRLSADQRLCELQLQNATGNYIFADLLSAEVAYSSSGWLMELNVRDAVRPTWIIPVQSARQARQWCRIVAMAREQKL